MICRWQWHFCRVSSSEADKSCSVEGHVGSCLWQVLTENISLERCRGRPQPENKASLEAPPRPLAKGAWNPSKRKKPKQGIKFPVCVGQRLSALWENWQLLFCIFDNIYPWFLNGGDFSLQGTFLNVWDIFDCHDCVWRRGWWWWSTGI